jgi:uncharacterized protein YndB with AHSA1/START domain
MRTSPAVLHVSVSIDRPPSEVYAFAADPANLPRWARGLSASIERVGDEWVAESPMTRSSRPTRARSSGTCWP